jgi:PhnB protein
MPGLDNDQEDAMAKPIPDGYHTITATMNVNGADKAIDFLARAFGAEERGDRMTTPDGKIMHTEVKIGDSIMMITDAVMDEPTRSSYILYVPDVDATYRRALEAGATSINAPENMFWGDRFARVRDAFGNRWGLATHVEDVSDAEMRRRAEAAVKEMSTRKPE